MARNNPIEEARRKFIAEAIRDSAKRLRSEADHLAQIADRMVSETGDLGYVNEAITAITAIPQNIRLDIIISRLIRSEVQ